MSSTPVAMRNVGYWAVTVGAAIRLTRFVTSDKLGDWLIVQPANEWASKHEVHARTAQAVGQPYASAYPLTWQAKAVEGLECPFCVGLWLGYGTLAVGLLASKHPLTRKAWQAVASGLAMNYVAGHLSSRID